MRICIAAGVAALFCVSAQAPGSVSDLSFTIDADSSLGSSRTVFDLSSGVPRGATGWIDWVLASPLVMTDESGDEIGTISELSLSVGGTQIVINNFVFVAGGADTSFGLGSPTLAFPPLKSPLATASAAVTVTDTLGDGATLTGLYPGGDIFRAGYNGPAGGGTLFTQLVEGPVSAGAFSSSIMTENTGGSLPIADVVSSMSTEWSFEVTAFDQASGTSVFALVPAPGPVGLCVIGLGCMFRRRRAV